MVTGRPSHFDNEEELSNRIAQYFVWIQGEYDIVIKYDEEQNEYQEKKWTRDPETPAITGLALFLGFESRQSIYDYEKKGTFSYTIKRARLKIELSYEQALLSRNSTGAIFALKNFGWTDKSEVTNTIITEQPLFSDDEEDSES